MEPSAPHGSTTSAEAGHPPAGSTDHGQAPPLEKFTPDLLEKGAPQQGVPQTSDRRLFCQLQAFTGCVDTKPIVEAARASRLDIVVYANVNDPRGFALVVMSEDPSSFTGMVRDLLTRPPFASLSPLPEFTMLGRTYALGREKDLEDWLLAHPRRNALNPANQWAVWYPLRRIGAFSKLTRQEQGRMMAEHAAIGRGYGEAGKASDIRLECHGLDRNDNEFVLGIVGPELFPLSKLIKDMRGTRQTSEFIQAMGPFFVGKVIYQAPLPDGAKASAGY